MFLLAVGVQITDQKQSETIRNSQKQSETVFLSFYSTLPHCFRVFFPRFGKFFPHFCQKVGRKWEKISLVSHKSWEKMGKNFPRFSKSREKMGKNFPREKFSHFLPTFS